MLRCSAALEIAAPLKLAKSSASSSKPPPWINDRVRSIRRSCRQAERKWKSSKDLQNHIAMKTLLKELNCIIKEERAKYFSNLIASNHRNPRVLFSTINSLLHRSPVPSEIVSSERCEAFQAFFLDKVSTIRAQIIPLLCTLPHRVVGQTLNSFVPVSQSDLLKIISSMKSSFSPADALPSRFLKEASPFLSTDILAIFNKSLSSGVIPSIFKSAIVQPLLKKSNLDSSNLNNFRPISKLPFLSKALEKVVYSQLLTFLNDNALFELFQSGFRSQHSTETALLKVLNDIRMNSDVGKCTVLMLLDLSAAFDTIDHNILLDRLENWVGVTGSSLEWFRSYLSGRTFAVSIGNASSGHAGLTCGVPQGSILGPLLFCIYLLPLGHIIRNFDVSFHFYADDTQIYFAIDPPDSVKTSETSPVSPLLSCLHAIKSWMSNNYLMLNNSKTETIVFGPKSRREGINQLLTGEGIQCTQEVRNLGVLFDADLKFTKHFSNITKTAIYQIRNIAKIRSFISFNTAETLIHAFVTNHLDYCNSLFSGLPKTSINRLQLIQNTAARILTKSRKYDHITPVLASLHWLPVAFRIDFKIVLFAFKALHGSAPVYIRDLLTKNEPTRTLRSADKHLLTPPDTKLVTEGGRSFADRAPFLWNKLPLEIKRATSVCHFKSLLKTHYFRMAFN